jgi:hypothetical protein
MIEFYGGYQVYSESGVDLTLLRENLKRPLAERWDRNCRMLPFLQELGKAAHSRDQNSEANRMALLDIPGLIRRLEEHQVQYVIIGGLAMIAQGSAYITGDFDICYSRSAANVAAVSDAFAGLHPSLRGAPPGLPFRFDAATILAGLNFTLTTDLGDVDLLGEVSGIGDYDKVLAQSEQKTISDLTVRVLTLDGLIAAKKATGRAKDRNHLLELEELKKMRQTGQ